MKVAFVFLHPFSESMGSVVRLRELSLSLEKYGVDIYILTPYERSFDLSSNVHVISMHNFINNVGLSNAVYKLTKFFYYSQVFPSLFSRSELQYNKIIVKIIRRIARLLVKKGVNLVQVEQDVALPIGLGLKREARLPLVVDLHNITSEELIASGVLERGSDHFRALQRRTQEYLSKTDHVIVVSESMREYVVAKYGLSPMDVRVIPPGGRPYIDKEAVKKRVKPIKVVYAGLVAYRERVDLFVKSIPLVKDYDETIRFYITDKGEAVRKIKKLASKLAANPTFFWQDDYESLNRFLSTCHIGVLPSSNDLARKMGTPVKLFSYMSAGLPVVACDIGGWSEIIKRERIGLLTSHKPEEIGKAIIEIGCNPKIMREYAVNGLELVERKYNWDNSARVLFNEYQKLLN